MKSIVINPDGQRDTTELDKPPSLSRLRVAVQGHIEVVPHFNRFEGEDCVVFCNEEGKLDGLPVNLIAQAHWEQALGSIPDDILVGPVCIITGNQEELSQL